MNCKQGEIARTVGLPPDLDAANHRFVRCMEPCVILGQPAWVLDRPIGFVMRGFGTSLPNGNVFVPGQEAMIYRLQDAYLRPIRGDDSEDEVLRESSKPNETVRDIIEAISA